jgi:hypothetical protein
VKAFTLSKQRTNKQYNMDDLWTTLPSSGEAKVPPPATLSIEDARSPSSLVEADISQESIIAQMIPQVSQICVWSNDLCQAAWEIADYVPPPALVVNPERDKLWKEILIPRVRSFLSHSSPNC